MTKEKALKLLPETAKNQNGGRPRICEIEPLGQLLGLDLEGTPGQLLDRAAHEMNQGALRVARAGCYFMALKQSVGNGEFVKAIEAKGFDPRRAQEAMQIATWLNSQPEERKRELAQLDSSKALALARAEPEVIEQLVQDNDPGDLDALSVRELRQKIKSLDLELRTENKKRETAEARHEKLQRQIANKADTALLPEFCVVMRQESVAQTEQMDLCLEALEQCQQAQVRPHLKGAQRHYAVRAAGTLYHALRGVLARVQEHVQSLESDFPELTKGPFKQEYVLNKGELALAKQSYELVKARHEALTHNRLVRRRKESGVRGRHGDEQEAP